MPKKSKYYSQQVTSRIPLPILEEMDKDIKNGKEENRSQIIVETLAQKYGVKL